MNLMPASVDNQYRGQKAALWLLGSIVFIRVAQSLNSIFNGDRIATSADGIPLAAYPSAAADTILSLFALLAFSRLIIALIALLVLCRYRSMVPFTFTIFLVDFLGRTAILEFLPIARGDAMPEKVLGIVMSALMVLGLLLSLWPRERRAIHDGADS